MTVTRNRVGAQAVDGVQTTTSNNAADPKKDNRTPSNPSTLTADKSLEFVSSLYYGMVVLTWVMPTTATDHSAMTPDHTEVWQLKGSDPGVFSRATSVDAPDHSIDLHGFGVGSTWQFKVRVMGKNGKLSAFSNTVTLTFPTQTAPPPQPSKPITYSTHSMVQVTWDGLAQGGAAMPSDFAFITVERASDPGFTVNRTGIGNITSAGVVPDGPFGSGLTIYYRFVTSNRLGQTGDYSAVSSAIVVGTNGADIVPGTIDPGAFTDELNRQIETAISSTTENAVPGNRIFGPTDTPPVGTADDPLLIGDLWFDSGNDNRPMRWNGSVWVDVRDSVVADAFQEVVNEGVVLAAPYILPDYVKTKLIDATVLDADKIIAGAIVAKGSITSDAGLFGRVDAGILNAGYLSANVIAASTISASMLLVADMTNLCDEPDFIAAGSGWVDANRGGAGTNLVKTIHDHPALAADGSTKLGDGFAYSARGNGTGYAIVNNHTVPAVETDQFYGEVWVRKTAAGTTGQVALQLLVEIAGSPPTTTTSTICSYTFTASDVVNKWIHLTGMLVPSPATVKPNPPTNVPWVRNTKVLAVGASKATPQLRVLSSVSNGGEVQFAGVAVRRKNDSNLIVDGSITADSLAAGAVTALEIKAGTITADNIAVGTITANNIHTGTLTSDLMDVGMLTGVMVQGDKLRTAAVDYSNPKNPVYSWPSIEISTAGGIQYAVGGNANDWLFILNPAAAKGTPSMRWRTSTTANAARFEIDTNGIRLYKQGVSTPTVWLDATDGSGAFTGDITGSSGTFKGTLSAGKVTGSIVESGPTNPRVWLDSGSITMRDAANNLVFRLLADSTAASGALRIDTVAYPRFFFDSNPTTGAMTFYDENKHIVFKLDFNSGALTTVGAITSGGIITGATVQTSAANPRIFMTDTAFQMNDRHGNLVVRLLADVANTTAGLIHFDTVTYPRFYLDSSATTGAMTFYDENKHIVFKLDFNDGSLTTVGAITSGGTITGADIRVGSTGTGARITLDGSDGLQAFNASNANVFYVDMSGNAWFKGSVAAGSTVSAPKIIGGTLSGTLTAGGSTISNPSLTTPTFGGSGTNNGTITGGTWRSSAGADRIEITGNTVTVVSGGNQGGYITNYAAYDDILIYGASTSGSLWLGYNNTNGAGGPQVRVYNGGSTGHGAIYNFAIMNSPITSIAGYNAVYCANGSGYMGVYTSSVRHKSAVQSIGLHSGFMDIAAVSWSDKPNRGSIAARIHNPAMPRRATGFTAENLHRAGLTDTVVYDEHRRPQSIQEPAILAHTVTYTQWLVRQVQDLTARVAALEGAR
jgi:hypothetical protein